jgi:hypothetical protein
MKLRHLFIFGVLVFLNGFVFTVLCLMVSREMIRPVGTPTETATVEPTVQPTFTATATGVPAQTPTATNTPPPTPTNTLVVVPPTPTPTSTPAPPTPTPGPPTATFTPAPPTPTSPPSSPTATSVPTATPTSTPVSSYEFRYVQGSMIQNPNCGTVYFNGKITGVGGEPVSGRTVRLRFAGNVVCRISGEGKPPGEWGFSPLAPDNYHSPFTFQIDIVESEANPVAQSDTVEIHFTDCGVAGQFTNITFAYAR